MTLIVAAFNSSQACVSTDTQLTNLNDPSLITEAVKSNYFYCKNGKLLAAYTGNDIYLEDGVHVSDWMTNLLCISDIRVVEASSIIQRITDGLNEKYYYKRVSIPPLLVLIVGWVSEGGIARPTTFRITNCETEGSKPKTASKQFEVFKSNSKRDVIVRGSIRFGVLPKFDNRIKHIKNLLKTVSFVDFKRVIGESLFDLNTIARANPEWATHIGESTMMSVIHKRGDGVDFTRFPKGQADYLLPNLNNGAISVKDARVRGDPYEGNILTLDLKR